MTTEGYPIKVINRTSEGSIHLLSLLLPYADLDIHRTGEATQFKLFVPPNADNTNENGTYKCIIYHRGKFVRVQMDIQLLLKLTRQRRQSTFCVLVHS